MPDRLLDNPNPASTRDDIAPQQGKTRDRGGADPDVAVNAAVLVALGVTKWTGWQQADPIGALAISCRVAAWMEKWPDTRWYCRLE